MAKEPRVSLIERITDNPIGEDAVADIEIEQPFSFGENQAALPEGIEIEMTDEGGVVIDLDPLASSRMGSTDFFANLAEEMSDQELGSISSELMSEYQGNRSARKDWEDSYSKGLELLGFTYEDRTQPFRGATGVIHPLLA